MNMNFGKVTDGKMEYVPDVVRVDGHDIISPNAEQCARAEKGPYLPNEDTRPTPQEGFYAASFVWASDGAKNYKEWRYEPIPPPQPKRYNKYDLGVAIEDEGKLDEFLALFESNAKLKFHWNNADEFEEGDKNFEDFKKAMVAAFGADVVAAILKAAEVGNA